MIEIQSGKTTYAARRSNLLMELFYIIFNNASKLKLD